MDVVVREGEEKPSAPMRYTHYLISNKKHNGANKCSSGWKLNTDAKVNNVKREVGRGREERNIEVNLVS